VGKRNPRIIVYDVRTEVEDDGVAALLKEQNEDSVKLAVMCHKGLKMITRKMRRRDVEVEVKPEVASKLVGTMIYPELSQCQVSSSVNVRRFYRC